MARYHNRDARDPNGNPLPVDTFIRHTGETNPNQRWQEEQERWRRSQDNMKRRGTLKAFAPVERYA